jgi:hypothetical protein
MLTHAHASSFRWQDVFRRRVHLLCILLCFVQVSRLIHSSKYRGKICDIDLGNNPQTSRAESANIYIKYIHTESVHVMLRILYKKFRAARHLAHRFFHGPPSFPLHGLVSVHRWLHLWVPPISATCRPWQLRRMISLSNIASTADPF